MWPIKKRLPGAEPKILSYGTAAAIIIATISLAVAAGVCRWSWLLLDEQVRLRQDYNSLKMAQEEINTQYEFWIKQVQKERDEIKGLQVQTPTKK